MATGAMRKAERWRRGVLAALLGAWLLVGCGAEPKPELSGHFGPGSGGAPISGTTQTLAITKASGDVVGYADYDDGGMTASGPTSDNEFENLFDATDNISITLTRITGRPDTPCRFQAAILARDSGYDILKSGPRKNDHGLDFYQVNLKNGGTRLSVFCTSIRDDVGVSVQVVTGSSALIDSLQVHFLLNSIRKS